MNWLSFRNNRLKFKTAGKRNLWKNIPQFNNGKPEDANM
jgi:hypothetical protein